MKKTIKLCCFLLTFSPVTRAVVDIPSTHIKPEKKGYFATIDISSEFDSGNSKNTEYEAQGTFDYRRKKYQNLIVYKQEYEKSDNDKSKEERFIHARHIHHIGQSFDYELFTQYQSNDKRDLTLRALLGSGIRQHLINKDKHNFYLGYGAYYTWENYEDAYSQEKEHYTRGSFYSAYKLKFKDDVEFIQRNYYQPRWNNSSDYYVYSLLRLQFKILEALKLYTDIIYTYDSKPFSDNKRTDVHSKFGFTLFFQKEG